MYSRRFFPFRSVLATLLLACLLGLATNNLAAQITIGPGPSIGTAAGIEYFESLQDWEYQDCRSVDPHGDRVGINSADNARDLIAFYAQDSPGDSTMYFRVDVHDLFIGVEDDNLNIYVLIDTGSPSAGSTALPDSVTGTAALQWEVAVSLYSTPFWNIYDQNLSVISSQDMDAAKFRGAQYYSDLDGVEFGIDRQILLDEGWDGTSELRFQVISTQDFNNTLVDSLPNSGSVSINDNCSTAKYAYVLHGNQAISPATTLQGLIWNETIRTPNNRPTGYRRALESSRIFGTPPNIHVSATLISSSLWAVNTGQPDDGPAFVQEIADFLDGDPSNGEGSLIWGVYSEHIMPFFEGEVNQDSIKLNEDYLKAVFPVDDPTSRTLFWIPERVARGSTFADLVATGYEWTILDQINHLREWFGNDDTQGYKIHNINGVNSFMINDEPDQRKFSITDDGLEIETRTLLTELANDADQEQIMIVFDDWEAYAGRSFLSFNEGSDNPDNFNTSLRWLANHPWIQVVNLEDVAGFGWTPIMHPDSPNLPFETYDFLDFATGDTYEHWYQGQDGQERDFDDAFPPIRNDMSQFGDQKIGALASYVSSNGVPSPSAGTIMNDLRVDLLAAGTSDPAINRLARLGYSTAIFETAWHDEFDAMRCPDGTFCTPDANFDEIAGFARQLQFLSLRRGGGIYTEAALWSQSPPSTPLYEMKDIDYDGEDEYIIANANAFYVFENDGGRLIGGLVKDPVTGAPKTVIGNLIGFPDTDDETEASMNGGFRTSGAVDWFAQGPDTDQYVNQVYTFDSVTQGRIVSGDTLIEKTFAIQQNGDLIANYVVDSSITTLFMRFGLTPDLENLLVTGQTALDLTDTGGVLTLANTATNVSIALDYGSGANNASNNTAVDDGTVNSPRNQAMIHMVELSGSGSFQYTIKPSNGQVIMVDGQAGFRAY